MEQDETIHNLAVKPADEESRATRLLRTLLSLAAFIAIDYWIFKSWTLVIILVSVILLHEMGHFIAMKLFGYSKVNMVFVPFAGAYVSGSTTDLSLRKKLIVLLAGPLPGILLGCLFLYVHHTGGGAIYRQVALNFLILNGFNLLPLLPLDGGQFFQALFFAEGKYIQLGFLYVSALAMLGMGLLYPQNWILFVIAVFLALKIYRLHGVIGIQRKLDRLDFDYACSYDDLTDEEYQVIRKVVIGSTPELKMKYDPELQEEDGEDLVKKVESVLVPAYQHDLSSGQKTFFFLLWLAAIVLPLLQIAYYQGVL